MNVTVRVEGGKEISRALKKTKGDIRKECEREIYATGLDIQGQARDNLKALRAWKTGNLAGSIEVDPIKDGLTVEIGPTAPYGPYIEYGTVKMAARPYLLPAYLALVNELLKKIKEILRR